MPIKDRDVHGYKVSGDDDAKEGIVYLDERLDYDEAKVFFEHARTRGSAQFEDDEGRNFTLVRASDGTYLVKKRSSSGGWF